MSEARINVTLAANWKRSDEPKMKVNTGGKKSLRFTGPGQVLRLTVNASHGNEPSDEVLVTAKLEDTNGGEKINQFVFHRYPPNSDGLFQIGQENVGCHTISVNHDPAGSSSKTV